MNVYSVIAVQDENCAHTVKYEHINVWKFCTHST